MSLLNKILGNASEVDINAVSEELGHLLLLEEIIEAAFAVIRDLMIFTSHRLILIDKQGISGNKQTIISIPYKSIESFAIQTPGTFDLNLATELVISVRGISPITQQFREGGLIFEIQKLLVKKIV